MTDTHRLFSQSLTHAPAGSGAHQLIALASVHIIIIIHPQIRHQTLTPALLFLLLLHLLLPTHTSNTPHRGQLLQLLLVVTPVDLRAEDTGGDAC